MKFIPISNTTLVVFVPNFTATHVVTNTNSSYQILHMSQLSKYHQTGTHDSGNILHLFVAVHHVPQVNT